MFFIKHQGRVLHYVPYADVILEAFRDLKEQHDMESRTVDIVETPKVAQRTG